MRWAWATLVVLAAVGCKRGRIEDIDRPPEEVPTQLGCLPGTIEMGATPPGGFDLWCARADATGSYVRHGPARAWWPDGRRRSVGFYANGLKTGHWWTWNGDGKLESEGDYLDDLPSGYWIHYRDDGVISEEGPMENGEREGLWVVWETGSSIPTQGLFVGGQREGTWIEYNADGKAVRERTFRRGREISRRDF
ncbi:MAG: hypothetical protein H6733_10535 [Alphaproteobacteria bacterium]|nr:hypothetical protein [Alphaproteobacteria bacterium]